MNPRFLSDNEFTEKSKINLYSIAILTNTADDDYEHIRLIGYRDHRVVEIVLKPSFNTVIASSDVLDISLNDLILKKYFNLSQFNQLKLMTI